MLKQVRNTMIYNESDNTYVNKYSNLCIVDPISEATIHSAINRKSAVYIKI